MSEQTRAQESVPRMSSGTPYLDHVLAGGWLRGGLYIVSGPPGTGKTTLGNEYCFNTARTGGRALYVTILAETHGRMLLHLKTLRFFDPDAVGHSVHYLSGYAALRDGGLEGLLTLLRRGVKEHAATALVIDGLTPVKELAGSTAAFRQFLHALSGICALHECTCLLLATHVNAASEPEYAMADGILTLSSEVQGVRSVRTLEVVKFRGSNHLPGKHTFLIDEGGVHLYPRFEAVHTGNPDFEPDLEHRLSWGVRGLDAMCGGGLIGLTTTLVLGSPGVGKTLLGMNFLAEGALRGERGLYLGFAESEQRLMRKLRGVGLDVAPLVQRGTLRLRTQAPVETLPDALVQELMEDVERQGYRRLFLGGLEPFANESVDPARIARFVTALFNALREKQVTLVVSQQTNALVSSELRAPISGTEAICDNIVFLRFVELDGRLARLISVLKMRESDNDPYLREFVITSKGMEVKEGFTSMEALLTGTARQMSGSSPIPPSPPEEDVPQGKGQPGRVRGLLHFWRRE